MSRLLEKKLSRSSHALRIGGGAAKGALSGLLINAGARSLSELVRRLRGRDPRAMKAVMLHGAGKAAAVGAGIGVLSPTIHAATGTPARRHLRQLLQRSGDLPGDDEEPADRMERFLMRMTESPTARFFHDGSKQSVFGRLKRREGTYQRDHRERKKVGSGPLAMFMRLEKRPGPVAECIDRILLGEDAADLVELLLERKLNKDQKEFISQLKPGDLFLSRRWKLKNPMSKAIQFGIRTVQGGPLTHTGIYVGKGNVVGGELHKGVVQHPLVDLMDKGDVRIVRPHASDEEMEAAVAHAKKMRGASYSRAALIRTGLARLADRALPFGRGKHTSREAEKKYGLTCSNMVAMAYPKQIFSSRVAKRNITPEHIRASKVTTRVADWKAK